MSDSIDDGVSIGGLTQAEEVNSSDVFPITQGYSGQGTGQTRKASISQLAQSTAFSDLTGRTIAYFLRGPLGGSELFPVIPLQNGTITNTTAGGFGYAPPDLTNKMTMNLKHTNGSIDILGTLTISASDSMNPGAVNFGPDFAVPIVSGETFFIQNQETADASGGNYTFSFLFTVG